MFYGVKKKFLGKFFGHFNPATGHGNVLRLFSEVFYIGHLKFTKILSKSQKSPKIYQITKQVTKMSRLELSAALVTRFYVSDVNKVGYYVNVQFKRCLYKGGGNISRLTIPSLSSYGRKFPCKRIQGGWPSL